MASFKAKFPVLQELFAKNHRRAPWPPPPRRARVNQINIPHFALIFCSLLLILVFKFSTLTPVGMGNIVRKCFKIEALHFLSIMHC